MKETIKVNLGQRLFDFEKEAYEHLKVYLETLKKIFRKSPNEADEILEDIEQRMAELLEEKQTGKKPVLTIEDIDEVIKMMGSVEDFQTEGNEEEHSDKSILSDEDLNQKENRRLHRDIDNNFMGGVCSGIAAYFNIDRVWVRLAFVLLFMLKGIGLLAYLILWLVVPAAKTTSQKLQMQGKRVNIENIEQSVREEYNKVKENARRYSRSDSYRKMQSNANEIFTLIGSALLTIVKVIFIMIGISFAVAGVLFILGLLALIPVGTIPFWSHISPYLHNLSILTFAIVILILIPVFGLLISSIRVLFNIKRENHILSAFFWTIWAFVLVYVIIILVSGNKGISFKENTKDEVLLKIRNHKVLSVNINNNLNTSGSLIHYNVFGKEIMVNKENEQCYIKPHFIVTNSLDTSFYLIIQKGAALPFSDDDHIYNKYLYNWNLNDTILIIDQYFQLEDEMIWTVPSMEIIINVPKGRNVVLNGGAATLFEKIEISPDTLKKKEITF